MMEVCSDVLAINNLTGLELGLEVCSDVLAINNLTGLELLLHK